MNCVKESGSVFIIAEVSANHGQDYERAVEMIKKAKECGADAVKFQAYTPDTLTIDSSNEYFMVEHDKWGGQTLYELYKKAYTPLEWLPKLKKVADKEDIIFFATAFDRKTVDLLEDLDVSSHKISSFELCDIPLIEYAAAKGKPLMLSTGVSDLDEITEAVDAARSAGAGDIILFRCVSSYPADPEDMNLSTIPDMQERFNCEVGLSDHSMGPAVSVAAAVLGATYIEKHFTLSRKYDTPDSFFSMEPDEFKKLVEDVKTAKKAIGRADYSLGSEQVIMKKFSRSLFAVNDIGKGEAVTSENVRSIRPSAGLKPKYFNDIIGKKVKQDIKKGTPIQWEYISTEGNKT